MMREDDLMRNEAEVAATDRLDAEVSDEEAAEVEKAEIRADIEEARVEMGGTLQELGDRLEPANLMDQAKENVREATIGRVEETAKGMTDMVMETVRQNPIPAALAGAGLALLWMNRSTGDDGGRHEGPRYSPYYGTTASYGQRPSDWREQQGGGGAGIGERAGEIGSQIGSRAGELGENVTGTVGQVGQNVQGAVGQGMREANWRFDRILQNAPLALGAIALGAGAMVGAIVPETRREQEMLGDASRQMGETVRQTVEKAGDTAEEQLDKAEKQMSSTKSGSASSSQ